MKGHVTLPQSFPVCWVYLCRSSGVCLWPDRVYEVSPPPPRLPSLSPDHWLSGLLTPTSGPGIEPSPEPKEKVGEVVGPPPPPSPLLSSLLSVVRSAGQSQRTWVVWLLQEGTYGVAQTREVLNLSARAFHARFSTSLVGDFELS